MFGGADVVYLAEVGELNGAAERGHRVAHVCLGGGLALIIPLPTDNSPNSPTYSHNHCIQLSPVSPTLPREQDRVSPQQTQSGPICIVEPETKTRLSMNASDAEQMYHPDCLGLSEMWPPSENMGLRSKHPQTNLLRISTPIRL